MKHEGSTGSTVHALAVDSKALYSIGDSASGVHIEKRDKVTGNPPP